MATMQKRLKEAFEVARHLTYEEATNNATIMIVELEPLLYSLGTLLWFVPMALWASEGKGPLGRRGFHC